MLRRSKTVKQKQPIATPATTTKKLPCRRSISERRVSTVLTKFPLIDATGAKINNDRRWRPDRRYDVEIQWLRG